MSRLLIPENYMARLSIYDKQKAIGLIHTIFEKKLSDYLSLSRVSAPLFLDSSTGMNDDLSGVERKVSFLIGDGKMRCEVAQSLAKWKRYALKEYDFYEGKGLYTDMNAIRKDEELDNLHSVYVDQWDWEKVININDRNLSYLKETVKDIVNAICDSEAELRAKFKTLKQYPPLDRNVSFVTTQRLENLYPDLSGKEREERYVRKHHTTCILQIGKTLKSGKPHERRAPDYDDWELNCDILFYHEPLDCALEISSMGIRVTADSLKKQLEAADANERLKYPFHQMLINGELPYTIGGGIGQSRLCMLLLGAAHIGEVQSAVWDKKTRSECKKNGIFIL